MSILFSSRALASLFVGLNLTRFALYEKTCLYEEGDVGMSNVYLTGGQLSGAQARAALGGLASWRSCLFVIKCASSSRRYLYTPLVSSTPCFTCCLRQHASGDVNVHVHVGIDREGEGCQDSSRHHVLVYLLVSCAPLCGCHVARS